MIGFYNYTVVLTYIGAVSGFAGTTYAWEGNIRMALLCLLFSGLCDMFDGKIASTMKRTKQEKRFGIQIDSLCDLVCFGVLPATIVFCISDKEFIHIAICAVYMLCALIRLAWFNVDEEERQDSTESARETYLGLPVTVSALITPFFLSVFNLLSLPAGKIAPWLLLITATAFITPFSIKKPGNTGKVVMVIFGLITLVLTAIAVKG